MPASHGRNYSTRLEVPLLRTLQSPVSPFFNFCYWHNSEALLYIIQLRNIGQTLTPLIVIFPAEELLQSDHSPVELSHFIKLIMEGLLWKNAPLTRQGPKNSHLLSGKVGTFVLTRI